MEFELTEDDFLDEEGDEFDIYGGAGSSALTAEDAAQRTLARIGAAIGQFNMTPTELFGCFDLDNDGMLTPDELRFAVAQLQLPLTEEEHAGILRLLDKDGRGLVSIESLSWRPGFL